MTTRRFAQVGGHAATLALNDTDSSCINKPASASERDFYTQLGPQLGGPDFVGNWTPGFYGTLKLQGRMGGKDGQTIVPVVEADGGSVTKVVDEMIVMENVTYKFVRPNVLDIKLGTQLHADDASEEKKARMIKTASETTSAETGVRLTGFQVWDSRAQAFHTTDKSFGKSIKPAELASGFAKFFCPPLSTHAPSAGAAAHPPPLPKSALLAVLDAILYKLAELISLLERFEVRIRGSSLLIVVEGDPEALESSLERATAKGVPLHTLRTSRAPEQFDELEDDDDDEDDNASCSTADSEGNPRPHALLPYAVKWIDFAHARRAEGEGKDDGLILGVETTKQLLRQLRERIAADEKRE